MEDDELLVAPLELDDDDWELSDGDVSESESSPEPPSLGGPLPPDESFAELLSPLDACDESDDESDIELHMLDELLLSEPDDEPLEEGELENAEA